MLINDKSSSTSLGGVPPYSHRTDTFDADLFPGGKH